MQENPFVRESAGSADSLSRLGLDPSQPFYDLNLAGAQGVPSPQMLAHPMSTQSSPILLPDFGMQDYEIPPIQPYNLTAPGITYMPAFTADPALPDLDEYTHPYNLDVITQVTTPDPQLVHDVPTSSEIASNLYPSLGFSTINVLSAVTDIDPLVPDLQHPDLIQQTRMPLDERPGDLDPSALSVMHATLSYQQASDTTYPEAWMDQHGMNTTRTRHMSLLNDGLDK